MQQNHKLPCHLQPILGKCPSLQHDLQAVPRCPMAAEQQKNKVGVQDYISASKMDRSCTVAHSAKMVAFKTTC